MKLEKAIEILEQHHRDLGFFPTQDIPRAVKLGIEALICIKLDRELHLYPAWKPLPGETKN